MRLPALLVAALLLSFPDRAEAQKDSATVIFVCEHGTVKSVVALAHFRKLVVERGLPFRAISRGTAPDSMLPTFMLEGLRHDGFDFAGFRPIALGDSDLAGALHVISFDQAAVAERSKGRVPVVAWDNLPSVTADYDRASAVIRRRVTALVDSLQVEWNRYRRAP